MINTVLTKISADKCCGCGVCFNKCPTKAISMKSDTDGFLYPVIDNKKCINCGLCVKSCPVFQPTYTNTKNPECYAAMAPDELRLKSSSGGLFSLFAEHILDNGGCVCGAAFKPDWSVHHIIIDSKEDLEKLRGSKYVQSDTENVYQEIKQRLKKQQPVLFSGTPCQVAGLYKFLEKPSDMLLTIEIVCHGTPSPAVWQQYLKEYNAEIETVSFRDKSIFQWATTMNILFKNKNEVHLLPEDDPYFKTFLPNISLRKSCGSCPFATLPRQADITLADFWGIEKFNPQLNDKMGTSLILTNTEKGRKYFELVQPKKTHTVPIEYALNSPNYPLKKPSPLHPKRKLFFELRKKYSIADSVRFIRENACDVAVLNFARYTNYGGILTAWSVHNAVKRLGYYVKTIDFVCDAIQNIRKKNNFLHNGQPLIANAFKKYFDWTDECHNYFDLKNLNNKANTFIIGSDQVWRHGGEHLWLWHTLKHHRHRGIYFGSFANNSKKLISYAASFGVDKFEGNNIITELTRHHIKRFDNISVRERTGIDICKNTFGVEATQTLEPVFLNTPEDWQLLIDDSTAQLPKQKYIAYYILDKNQKKEQLLKEVCADLNMEAIDLSNDLTRPVNDFLKYLANAEFVVTDSFHGCCFATIFKRKFIGIINSQRGATRFELFQKFGLSHRIISQPTAYTANKSALLKEIDFSKAYQVIEKEKEFSLNWLSEALKAPKQKQYTENENFLATYFDDTENEINGLRVQIGELQQALLTPQKQQDINQTLHLLLHKDKLMRRYRKYKILSKITFGNKRKHYIQKYRLLREDVKKLRKLQRTGI